ncbi:hypothetical protein F8M41_000202 [Gigaspora margarita]|uniref:Uncharacterized protein n=1 Tax=Gigaspora margarita TaxID=4874 RepID=A0A8H4AA26_GIGMA|nr:hypothetical protein F8M41_000202 [Gigaspora margarita]
MPNRKSISENKLDDLLVEYLKTLDNLITKLQKGQKAKDKNKIYKVSVYYQKSTQYKTYTSRSTSGLEKDEDKISMYCQKSTEIGAATKTYTIEPCDRKESEGKEISNQSVNIKIDEQEASDHFQRPTNMGNNSGCYYMDPIAVARNNEATKDATKSAEVEETIYLSSHIKA